MRDNLDIANEVVESGLLDDCIYYQFRRLAKTEPWKAQFSGDLRSDVYLALAGYDNAKLNDAYDNRHMNALITRIIRNNLYSASSAFYYRYIKFMAKSGELSDIWEDGEWT